MAKADTEICPYCGHVILDDDQEYCDWCGSEIKKDEIPDKKTFSGSCLGSIGALFFVVLIILLLVVKK